MNYVTAFAHALRRHGITPGGGREDFTGVGELAELATAFLNALPTAEDYPATAAMEAQAEGIAKKESRKKDTKAEASGKKK